MPQFGPVDSALIMRNMYETMYGIYNHMDKTVRRPLASVAFHPAENTVKHSLLEESLRLYANKNIKDIFGLSVLEFFELPMDVVNLMLDIAEEISDKKSGEIDAIQRGLNHAMKH